MSGGKGSTFGGQSFSATRWSLVLAAKNPKSAEAALGALCGSYWFPLYAYVRRQGYGPHDAEDLTQGFFAQLLERDAFANVSPERGRFRSFLLASLKHYLADERDRARAQKRGGGKAPVSFDACEAEERYAMEPHDNESPDRLYDRKWALAVIECALRRLEREYAGEGKEKLFGALKPLLTVTAGARPYLEIGLDLGLNEGAVKVAVHRLRQRYRAALRAEIAETVQDPRDVDGEMRQLLDALG